MTRVRQWVLWLGRVLVSWGTAKVVVEPPVFTPLLEHEATALRSVFAPAPKSNDKVEEAVRKAHEAVGLPAESFDPNFDLMRTGKLYDVLHYASEYLEIDHGIRTSGDVSRYLGGR